MTLIKERKHEAEIFQPFCDDIPLPLQKIFFARGIKERAALDWDLNNLPRYNLLSGIDAATQLLANAIIQQQKILIIGDFDADGATSSALGVAALKAMGAKQIHYLVPNRFEYGYGLTSEIVIVAWERYTPDLIITVDNGISSVEGVNTAHELGIRVLITDHHLPPETLPSADAIVNPNLQQDIFPSKNLAGVGVMFYVLLALRAHLRALNWFTQQNIEEPKLIEYLDLVALGTVADVVPLDWVNRILVQQGMKRIRHGFARPGIKAILTVAGKDLKKLSTTDLAFAVAPRLNAAGRLDDMSVGIACLLATDDERARKSAMSLNHLNEERKFLEQEMHQQALMIMDKLQLVDGQALPECLCMWDPNWHQGVIGIIAGRLKERFHRPAFVFAEVKDNELKGSARSIPGLHIRDLLTEVSRQYPEIIDKFGGHAMAAGLSLSKTNYPKFEAAVLAVAKQQLSADQLTRIIYSDGELTPEAFTVEFAKTLQSIAPWGQAFPEPLFEGTFRVSSKRIVADKHLKLWLEPKEGGNILQAMLFNAVHHEIWHSDWQNIHCLYRLNVNEYNGFESLQLMVEYVEERQ